MTDPRPIWWSATEVEAPDAWIEAFNALTHDERSDELGLAAGIFIARVRRRAQWLNAEIDDESVEDGPSAIEQLVAGQLDSVLRDARYTAWAWGS